VVPEEEPTTGYHDPAARRRVVLLAGPSGAGKSRLAGRLHRAHGWPVVRLDDFYRDADDPAAPRHAGLGIVDWDHLGSWDGDAAVAALAELVGTGRTSTPVYDIGTSRAVGRRTVTARPGDLVVAEGIFAADVVPALDRAGLLHSAWCIAHGPRVTFARRLLRDLKERRKAPPVLVRRGLALMRAQPEVVARANALGARSARPSAVEAALASAVPAVG
jgi:uridine kinase